MRIRHLATVAILCLTAGAVQAQVVLSISSGEHAHACYVAAKIHINLQQGLDDCTTALQIEDLTERNKAAVLNNRGIIYDALKQYQSAWNDFSSSVMHDATLGDPYLNMGVAQIRLNQPGQALQNIQKGLSLGISQPALGYYDLAVAQEELGQNTDAYHNYKYALTLDPDLAAATEALKRFRVISGPNAQADQT